MTSHQDSILSLLKRLREVHSKHNQMMQENTRPLSLLKLYEELGELQRANTWANEMEEACDLLFMTFAYMFEISSDAEVLDWMDRKLQIIEDRVGIING